MFQSSIAFAKTCSRISADFSAPPPAAMYYTELHSSQYIRFRPLAIISRGPTAAAAILLLVQGLVVAAASIFQSASVHSSLPISRFLGNPAPSTSSSSGTIRALPALRRDISSVVARRLAAAAAAVVTGNALNGNAIRHSDRNCSDHGSDRWPQWRR